MANQETGLVVQQSRELLPAGDVLNSMYEVAKRIVNTPLVPALVKSPEAAFAIMLKGRELGMPIMASLSGIYIIGGKPALYADAMLAIILRDHGHSAAIITETDDQRCTMVYQRPGWSERRSHTYTIEMAKQAKLVGGDKANPNWTLRPSNMLRARCISEVARMAFPDSIGGLYTVEEMQDAALEDARTVTPTPMRTVVETVPNGIGGTHRVETTTGEVLEQSEPDRHLVWSLCLEVASELQRNGTEQPEFPDAEWSDEEIIALVNRHIAANVTRIDADGPEGTITPNPTSTLGKRLAKLAYQGIPLDLPKLTTASATWLANTLGAVLNPTPETAGV